MADWAIVTLAFICALPLMSVLSSRKLHLEAYKLALQNRRGGDAVVLTIAKNGDVELDVGPDVLDDTAQDHRYLS